MSTLNVGTNVQISGTNRKITGVLGAPGIIPTGAVIYTAANTGAGTPVGSVPPGYLPCDGAAYSQAAYPELYAAIRDTFSTGAFGTALINPATGTALPTPPVGQFRVPQLQGEFIRCWDGPVYTSYDPTVSGRIFGSYQAQDWKGFSMTNTGQNTNAYSHGPVDMGKSTTAFVGNLFTGYWAAPASATGTRWNSTDEIRPRNIALFALIKY
jgi:hypothetical protein